MLILAVIVVVIVVYCCKVERTLKDPKEEQDQYEPNKDDFDPETLYASKQHQGNLPGQGRQLKVEDNNLVSNEDTAEDGSPTKLRLRDPYHLPNKHRKADQDKRRQSEFVQAIYDESEEEQNAKVDITDHQS